MGLGFANRGGYAILDSNKTWYQILWTAPKKGYAYYILAHAYIAAKLNELNGADTSVVASELAQAEAWFDAWTEGKVPAKKQKGCHRKRLHP